MTMPSTRLNHAFCSRPSNVTGGSPLRKLGTSLPPNGIASGGLLPLASTRIEDFHRFLREEVREVVGAERVGVWLRARIFHRVAVVVRDDEIDVLSITHRAIAGHAADATWLFGSSPRPSASKRSIGLFVHGRAREALQSRA